MSTATVASDGTTSTCSGGVTISGVTVAGTPATLDDDGLHVDRQAAVPGLGLGQLASPGARRLRASQARVLGGDDACDTASPAAAPPPASSSRFPLPELGLHPGRRRPERSCSGSTVGHRRRLDPAGRRRRRVRRPAARPRRRGRPGCPGPFSGGGLLAPCHRPRARRRGGGTALADRARGLRLRRRAPARCSSALLLLALARLRPLRRYLRPHHRPDRASR